VIRGIVKPAKPYKAKKLVHGFCVAAKEGSGESLICTTCDIFARASNFTAPSATPVTFDGKVKCSRCGEVLK
jgi:hypothetical protein